MKTLVVGGGSIGTRHLHNLRNLDVNDLAVVEPDPGHRAVLEKNGFSIIFNTLEKGLKWKPDVVFITTPTHLHIKQALMAVQNNCHLFIEKPLSYANEGLGQLLAEIKSRDLISFVGCNMRFHPGPTKVKDLIKKGSIGRILFARIHTGSYLPNWHPKQDYRRSYSANASMGGGCILDCIHEIDLARWYLGDVEVVFCMAGHLSPLEVDVEDVAVLVCRHIGGALSEIHLDYVQRTYERGCQVVGERGSIFWDYNTGTVRWFEGNKGVWSVFTQPEDWDINQMYIDEIDHFLKSIRVKKPTILPIPDAVKVMQIVFAAKISATSGCLEYVQGGLL